MIKRTSIRLLALGVGLAVGIGSAAGAEKTIKIGSELPLTGGLARVGTGMHEGITVAIQEANERYEGEYQFELITIDNETSPARAVAAVRKLASQGVVALTGGYGSNIIGPASETAHELGLPYVTSGGVAKGLSRRGFNDFFRINNLPGYSKAMVGLIKSLEGVDKVSIIYNNKEATTGLAKVAERELGELGIETVLHGFSGGGGNDFTALMNRIRLRDRPDVIAMVGYENDYVGILRAGQVLKPDVKAMIGVWSLATSQMNQEFNELMQGVSGTSMLPYPVTFTNEQAQAFAARYKKLYNATPDYLAQFGYVQTRLLLEAIVRAAEAGEITGDSIAREMHETDTQTLIGRVAFNENGDNPYFSHRMGQHQGDRVEIVWPEAAATAEMMLPGRPW